MWGGASPQFQGLSLIKVTSQGSSIVFLLKELIQQEHLEEYLAHV